MPLYSRKLRTPAHRGSWADGYFEYDNQDLRTMMQEIGEWYNLTVIFRSPHLLDERIHFRLSRRHSADTVLQVLDDMGIGKFVMSDGEIVVE